MPKRDVSVTYLYYGGFYGRAYPSALRQNFEMSPHRCHKKLIYKQGNESRMDENRKSFLSSCRQRPPLL